MLQIQLLDGFDLSYGNQSLTEAASERLQSLLAYLVLNRQKAHYNEARAFLQQALQLAQKDQDRWRECNCLTGLIMTELELGDTTAALSYCETMTNLVAQIEGKESESAVTAAVTALAHYQL